ncbi:hypothetical protein ACLBWP_02835 [Microbacterium sp. M1A1_1b]
MLPFIVLLVTSAAAWLVGRVAPFTASVPAAVAVGLAAMFLLTASAHFVQPRRDGLVAIVPRALPNAAALVTVSGLAEVVGAIGLLLPATRSVAAVALAVLLVVVFPANVRAAGARRHPASPTTPLPLRTVLQVVFTGACLLVAIGSAGG